MMHCVYLFLCHIKKLMIHCLYHIVTTHCTSFWLISVVLFLNLPFVRHLGWDKIKSQIIGHEETWLQSNCCFSFCTKTLIVLVLNCVTSIVPYFCWFLHICYCFIWEQVQIAHSKKELNFAEWKTADGFITYVINIYLLVALSKAFCYEHCCSFSWILWFLSFLLVIFCFTPWLNVTFLSGFFHRCNFSF